MLEHKLSPRFKDTDAMGHINNASLVTWFEEGRKDIFKMFIPDLDPSKWNLIIARLEVDYMAQGDYQRDCVIHTHLKKIGNSSFTLYQECYQEERLLAKAICYMVHFDYEKQSSVRIPDDIRRQLEKHLIVE